MHEITLKQRAESALVALGDTAEKVAHTLMNGGWRGRPHESGTCPIALYLMTVLPGVLGVIVGSDRATIHPIDEADADAEVHLTAAVAGFVLAFDIGAFPELIAQSDAKPDI